MLPESIQLIVVTPERQLLRGNRSGSHHSRPRWRTGNSAGARAADHRTGNRRAAYRYFGRSVRRFSLADFAGLRGSAAGPRYRACGNRRARRGNRLGARRSGAGTRGEAAGFQRYQYRLGSRVDSHCRRAVIRIQIARKYQGRAAVAAVALNRHLCLVHQRRDSP